MKVFAATCAVFRRAKDLGSHTRFEVVEDGAVYDVALLGHDRYPELRSKITLANLVWWSTVTLCRRGHQPGTFFAPHCDIRMY